ncbi:globin domain-containing protein [Aliiroseovarius lamellibrachiae]|uniref:globin domain-containing protein n=1 Tax=Aliiroseovarius lamellibrachiae TaxID=1924933 RepID=UPI001BE06AA7|nr:globin domain-containing protein [Aliiroseovarius lamellibrachiae]MBT2131273.1 hypothetical protein [Aliiroseovarius lamellibrachiae]
MDPNDAYVCQDSLDLLAGQDERFVDALYAEVFVRAPEIRLLFDDSIEDFAVRQSIMLRMAVGLLDDPKVLGPKLRSLGGAHAARGVKDHHYPVVAEAIVTVLSDLLGGDWRPEFEHAWRALMAYVATEMILGAQDRAA